MKRQHITNANACIAYPNPGSILFHERMGYREVGHFTRCGYKLGRWYDMIWMEKLLSDHPADPKPVVPARELAFEPVRFEAHPTSPALPGWGLSRGAFAGGPSRRRVPPDQDIRRLFHTFLSETRRAAPADTPAGAVHC